MIRVYKIGILANVHDKHEKYFISIKLPLTNVNDFKEAIRDWFPGLKNQKPLILYQGM